MHGKVINNVFIIKNKYNSDYVGSTEPPLIIDPVAPLTSHGLANGVAPTWRLCHYQSIP